MTEPHGAPLDVDLLITNAFVITMDPERHIVPAGAVAVKGRTIELVGPADQVAARVRARRTIDAGGGQVHPGFVECHNHVTYHLIRGALGDTCGYFESGELQQPWMGVIRDEYEHASALLACVEMIRNGTTCFVEAGTTFETETVAEAARAVGIRAVLGDPFIQDVGSVRGTPLTLDRALDVMGTELKRNRDPDALVRGHVALIGMGTASDELTLAAKQLADLEGVVLNQHQSYHRYDTENDDRRYGKHPLVHQEEAGLLGPNCLHAHANFLRPDEFDPILRNDVSLGWCPAASMIWGVGGTFRGHHAVLHRLGANVALGSDSTNWANSFDIGQQAYLAVLTAREQHRDRDALNAGDALAMATINGAKAICLDHMIGSIEPGKRADLVIRSRDVPEAFPGHDPVAEIVYSEGAKSIGTVVVDGRVVMEDRRHTGVDAHAVYTGAEAAARDAFDRAGFTVSPYWPVLEELSGTTREEIAGA